MDNELPSTGVADRKQLFIQSIKKSVGFVNRGQWNEKNLVGETTFLNGIIYQSINGKISDLPIKNLCIISVAIFYNLQTTTIITSNFYYEVSYFSI